MKRSHFSYKGKTGTVFILLVLILLPIYFNTFHASFQFDDKPNIIDNPRLQISDLSPASLWKALSFYRPLSNLSIALNWYMGGDEVFGYHLVNFTIHILSAFFLYLTILNLLQTPITKIYYKKDDVYFISLLSAVLWAINPIQTQAVTYIIQRMASMAAMFCIFGIYFYLKARLNHSVKKQALFYIGCLLSFVFALMSKENAVMLLPSLLLVEVIFFQGPTTAFKKIKDHWITLAIVGIVLILLGTVAFSHGMFDFLFRGFASRPFTLIERLLTEPRIVLFYISQIFYPLPERLSITHDIIVSKSLLSPWTTLPAILTILLVIGMGMSQIKKRPVMAFAILFFFLNHVIESTCLPLELIFEHRNYLPSFFVFLPVAAGLKYLFDYYKTSNRSMYAIMATFVTLVIIGMGCFTYIRNRTWRTETTLWQDAMKKAPRDSRPPWKVAVQLAWGKNVQSLQLEVALVLFEKALSLNHARSFLEAHILRNMGIIYYHQGAYAKAVQAYTKGIEIDPSFVKNRYDLIRSLIMMGKWTEALEQAEQAIANKQGRLDYFKLKGFILLWQKKPEEALTFLRKALKMEPNNAFVLLDTGVALSLMGRNSPAELFLKKARTASPGDIRPVYALIENSVRAGNLQKVEKYVAYLFKQFSIQTIIAGIDIFTESYRTAPMSPELIIPVVKQKMMQLSGDLEMLTLQPRIE